jgi:hypothetical protein
VNPISSMAPTSIVFPDPLFLFQTPTKTMNRGFTVISVLFKKLHNRQSPKNPVVTNKINNAKLCNLFHAETSKRAK